VAHKQAGKDIVLLGDHTTYDEAMLAANKLAKSTRSITSGMAQPGLSFGNTLFVFFLVTNL
jgi:hypothetical protein